MLNPQELKQKACAAIESRKQQIVAAAREVLANPEPGFSETKTARLVARHFQEMGIAFRQDLALTGVKGRIPGGGGPGPRVAILGELDSLIVNDHPHADQQTGAAHACGHHCQIGMMLGAAIGLMQPEVLKALSGEIIPFAVPAEEFIEVEQRLKLREAGRVEFLGGKQELIRLGEFDDVDLAMMCHTASDMNHHKFAVGGTSNGHVVKYVQFKGLGAHAGAAPHRGINALNAATFAIQAMHANRETFQDADTVRLHGIMTRGGEAVSAVPADVRLEWRVRSGSTQSVAQNSAVVDRCLKAGALAVGASVKITTIPGYLPMRGNPRLQELFLENAGELVGHGNTITIPPRRNRGGSTDMGDLSQLMPVCHPYVSGAVGSGHSKDYLITDYEAAVVNPAKVMAMVVIDLLCEGAAQGKDLLASQRPALQKSAYLKFQREQAAVIDYNGGA
ncbi:MAG: amidohydrolase [Dehalococcoidia bacterium]|nr:amidohydrolase [Dehalococcoidia bacterium]MSQ16250.1 amidohydrolase [Dehalococcoidia bacterium]